MIEPPIPENEAERVAALMDYQILDTLPEKDFDDITRIAAEICGTPISLVSLIDPDRQWFKSHHGLAATETPRNVAFCAHAINKPDEVLVVPDASKDERFHDNPLSVDVPDVIFYAGAPLVSPEGYPLGTLCVIDHQPREITNGQLETLKALANQVIGQMELRKKVRLLERSKMQLEEANEELESFAHVVAHDLKAPLRGITSVVAWLEEEFEEELGEQGKEYLQLLNQRSVKMHDLIQGILTWAKSGKGKMPTEPFILQDLIREVEGTLNDTEEITISLPAESISLVAYRFGMQQILQNLLSNAIKYNDKPSIEIRITCEEKEDAFHFRVCDNGSGIPEEFRDRIFGIFQTLGTTDRFEMQGSGIGLATVKKLVERMGGTIAVGENDPELGGACFNFSIEK